MLRRRGLGQRTFRGFRRSRYTALWQEENKGLPGWAIAVIAAGGALFSGVLIFFFIWLTRKDEDDKREGSASADPDN
jgi:hypothetical protein